MGPSEIRHSMTGVDRPNSTRHQQQLQDLFETASLTDTDSVPGMDRRTRRRLLVWRSHTTDPTPNAPDLSVSRVRRAMHLHQRARMVSPRLATQATLVDDMGRFRSDPRLYVCQAPGALIRVSTCGSILGPFWVHFGSILGPFWVHSGSILGPFWVHSGSILGPFWVHFGSILGPFWVHSGSILGPFWVHSGSILGPFWVHSGSILGPFWVHSGSILGPFV